MNNAPQKISLAKTNNSYLGNKAKFHVYCAAQDVANYGWKGKAYASDIALKATKILMHLYGAYVTTQSVSAYLKASDWASFDESDLEHAKEHYSGINWTIELASIY